MKPPVFYFGGKRKIAPELWKRFGKPNVYIEPFVGMAATLLAIFLIPVTYYVVERVSGRAKPGAIPMPASEDVPADAFSSSERGAGPI